MHRIAQLTVSMALWLVHASATAAGASGFDTLESEEQAYGLLIGLVAVGLAIRQRLKR